MRANATPARWHRVPGVLFQALQEAFGAYERTRGVFDPRVLSDLVSLGYDASMRFDASGDVSVERARRDCHVSRSPWRPRFRAHKCDVWLGEAVELGGIGKGLAVRWASEVLAPHLSDYLIEAGGDCYLAGHAPDGEPWRVGVEDPFGEDTPVAVLSVSDRAVATSSIRTPPLARGRAAGAPLDRSAHAAQRRRGFGRRHGRRRRPGRTPKSTPRSSSSRAARVSQGRPRPKVAPRCGAMTRVVVGFSAAMRPYVCWERA